MATILESRFSQATRKELRAARENSEPIHNLHEAYTRLLVKLDEFWGIVRIRQESREPTDIAKLLAQLAAESQRACEDLGVVNELPQASDSP